MFANLRLPGLAVEGFQGSPRGDVTGMFPYMRCDLRVSFFNLDLNFSSLWLSLAESQETTAKALQGTMEKL